MFPQLNIFAQSRGIPKGAILLWSGSIASIPAGWQLCDGTNGSPNLKNVFVVGAGDTYVVDAVGGLANHSHNFDGGGHTHDHLIGGDIAAGTDFDIATESGEATGSTDASNSLPPYRALAYIMKL